jgi:hypothetical protein
MDRTINLIALANMLKGIHQTHLPGESRERLPMPLIRDFHRTVQARATRDRAFGKALFREAVQTLLQGDIGAGRAGIRAYINATVGFEKLSVALGRPQKSLMRMFGSGGNPTAENRQFGFQPR